jgi:Protein of unknown function (DUF3300)
MHRLVRRLVLALAALILVSPLPAAAQDAQSFKPEQLDQMLAPIALYPDALLSQVLMAATYPSDVALAVAWAKAHQDVKGDAAVKAVESQPWDPSVQSLLAFPQVLALMGAKPDWVQSLGDAFLADPNAVMNSVQQLRAKAQQAGNLKSNEQQTVATEPAPPPAAPPPAGAPPPPVQIITIAPANPQVVYVPAYNPTYVYGPWWYPAYPPYYIPPPPGWGFAAGVITAGIAWGVGIGVTNALWGGMNWGRGDVNINVNRYNNINVNNRINSNNNNVNWNHNNANRNGVPYRNTSTRNQYQNQLPGAANRQDYRGRDAQRTQAEQTLSSRVGAQNMNPSSLQNVDRSTLQNRGAGGQYGGGARDGAGGANYNQLQGRMGTASNNDNALRGAGNSAQTRQQMDRGSSSMQTMNRPQTNNRPQNMGGGAGARPSGGGGARPAGGGGGGAARGGRR